MENETGIVVFQFLQSAAAWATTAGAEQTKAAAQQGGEDYKTG